MLNSVKRPPQDRRMIKYGAREALRGKVFVCFLACLLPMVASWILRLVPVQFGAVDFLIADTLILSVSVPMTLLSIVLSVFVTDPMTVRLAGYFLTLNREPENLPSPVAVCDCFGPGYMRLMKTMLLRTVRIRIWALLPLVIGLLVPGAWERVQVSGMDVIRVADWMSWVEVAAYIPGLVAGLVYMMTPYVLIDRPELSPGEVLAESRQMTRGRRLELFVLELSFFGWILLSAATFGFAAIYLFPYLNATTAGYYIAFSEPMPWEAQPVPIPGDDDAAG